MSESVTTPLVLDAVKAIYDAATAPDLWPAALQAIADCTGDVGTVLMWQREDGSFGTIVSDSIVAAQADYEAKWWAQDIRAERGVALWYSTTFDTATDRDVVSDEEVAGHPIYTDFLVPHGLGWFAAAYVAPDPRIYAVLSVQRHHGRPRFCDEEVRQVALLGRHVEQSLRLSIRLIGAELTAGGLLRALSAMNIGVFSLDGAGRVTSMNPVGEAMVGAGLTLADRRLLPETRADRGAFTRGFEATLSGAVTLAPTRPVLLQGGSVGERLVVHFIPLGEEEIFGSAMLTEARVLVLIVRLGPDEPLDPSVVRDLLGLTLNEARVATLIGNGQTPRSAAERLGITEGTARTVLKRVFSKTGVSRQSELVALLARLSLR